MNIRLAKTAQKAARMQIEGGGLEPKILEDFYANRKPREYEDVSPTIRSERGGLKVLEPSIISKPHGYFEGSISDITPTVKSSAYAANNPIVEQHVLGWSRDEHGNVIDRHPVDVANCVTSAKRDNTHNYVQEMPVDAVAVGRERTDAEKRRRHLHGDKGAKFSRGKQLCVTGDVGGCVTTGATMDNLCAERRTGGVRVRRLTERELFRLMDVDEPDIDTLLCAGIPKTQLAKMAGNSIVVDVLYHIFKRLLVDTEAEAGTQMKLF